MGRFEFNLVLVSILLAFAATEQLAVWGRVLRTLSRFGFSWPYRFSSLYVLFAIVIHWFLFWAYRDVEVNQARCLFLLILPSLFLDLRSFALAPDPDAREPILESHWKSTSCRPLASRPPHRIRSYSTLSMPSIRSVVMSIVLLAMWGR